jgi:protein tyrosine/serine phosphatase
MSQNHNRQKSVKLGGLLARTLVVALASGLLGLSVQARSGKGSGSDFGLKVDNFGQVNDKYYRGGQPTERDFADLKRLGIKTIIDLQEDAKSSEAGWVRSAGMQYINVPLSSRHPASAQQTAYFLSVVNDPANLPVFVHCAGGRHRTGAMTAIYRITHDGWTAERSFEEMKKYDWYSMGGHAPLKDYVYSYYQEHRMSLARTTEPENTSGKSVTQQ